MKFRTFSSCRETRVSFPSPAGSRYKTKFIRSFDEEGLPVLLENGVEDVYDTIQKAAVGITVTELIARFNQGDSSAIPAVLDSFVDISEIPSDILSAHMQLQSAKERFNALPADVKSKFKNNFGTFMKSIADGSALSVVNSVPLRKEAPLSDDELKKIRESIGGVTK